jgi:putative hydrolase of the HAD superfamily
MTLNTIGFDGDDTLWHHDIYWRDTLKEFSVLMNRLGHFPDAGEQLDAQHINDLKLWGYGIKGLILSMVELSIRMTKGQITGTQIQEVVDLGKRAYHHPMNLLPHVRETLAALKGRYFLILITKGDLVAQEMKIDQSGLKMFFDAIEIVSEKDTPTYQRILDRYNVEPSEFIMVGNALRSDILPPLSLKAQAVHIPYHTSWHFE